MPNPGNLRFATSSFIGRESELDEVPMAAAAFPEMTTAIAHLREVLGDKNYESLAGTGAIMTTADMVA